MAGIDIVLVAKSKLDAYMADSLLQLDGAARKVVASMIATTPGMSGGGTGGGTSVVGTAPFSIADNGDGTSTVTVTSTGAFLDERPDGTILFTLEG